MIRLSHRTLPDTQQQVLTDLQSIINSEADFAAKQAKAKALWQSKGNAVGKRAFVKITEQLYDLCVYVGVCNYCEQNEGNDIEHIYPKSFFPEYTFIWENYILACKQCNSAYKLDKCYVLDAADNLVFVNRGEKPATKQIAMINPRIEDPAALMMLDLSTYQFILLPNLSTTNSQKTKATLKILELNERDTLLAARKSAVRHYYDSLDRLIRILDADTLTALQAALSPYDDRFDFSKPMDKLKSDIKKSYQQYISTYQHPSVWLAIKVVGSKTNPRWQQLFERFPEALNW